MPQMFQASKMGSPHGVKCMQYVRIISVSRQDMGGYNRDLLIKKADGDWGNYKI